MANSGVLMIEVCQHCPNSEWCGKRGCTAWNDNSRRDFEELKRCAKEWMDEIDELLHPGALR